MKSAKAGQAPAGYRQLEHLAARRYGLFNRRDFEKAEVSAQAIRRRVRSGGLQEILPGVYRFTAVPDSWEQRLTAALLWGGPNACLSHRSAAALLQLDGFESQPVEITTTRSLKTRGFVVVHRVQELRPFDVMRRAPFTLTTPARTLLDLAAVESIDRVELALEDALRRRLTTMRAVRWELRTQGGSGRPGSSILKELVAQRPDGYSPTASRLELRVDRILRAESLPRYERQVEVSTRAGTLRTDFAFPSYRVAVEADSYRWHSGRRVWQRDKARDRALRAAGWEVIYVTWEDISRRRRQFIEDVVVTLRRAGWNG